MFSSCTFLFSTFVHSFQLIFYLLAFHIVSISDILLLIQSVMTQLVKIRMRMALMMAVTTVDTPQTQTRRIVMMINLVMYVILTMIMTT